LRFYLILNLFWGGRLVNALELSINGVYGITGSHQGHFSIVKPDAVALFADINGYFFPSKGV
jgi:hypothetical protein